MLTSTAENVELAALALALGGHAAAYAASRSATSEPAQGRKATTTVPFLEPTQNSVTSFPGGIIWLTAPLVVAALCRRVSSRIAQRRVAGTPAAQALARLSAAENSLSTQQESLTTMARHLDKLQTRTRIGSRDVRTAIKALDAGAQDQTELLRGAAVRLGKVENDVRDLEGLVEAVQVVSAKQFDLLAAVVAAQQRAGGVVGGKAGAKKATAQKIEAVPKMSIRSGNAAPAPAAAAIGVLDGGSAKDEWGRAVTAEVVKQGSDQIEAVVEERKNKEGESGAAKKKETPATDGVDMKLNDDGSVSFSFLF